MRRVVIAAGTWSDSGLPLEPARHLLAALQSHTNLIVGIVSIQSLVEASKSDSRVYDPGLTKAGA